MMKKYLLIALAAVPLCLSAAVKTAVVNANGSLAYPTAATFAAKNNLVSQEVVCIRVDMFAYATTTSNSVKAYYWTDVELKVLDKNGALIYFIPSDWCDRSYHTDHPELIDNGARIAYYPFGNGITGVCAHKKVWLGIYGNDSYTDGSSISNSLYYSYHNYSYNSNGFYAHVGVSTVEIYPNLSGTVGGKSVREIFLDPENTILVSRKNNTRLERSEDGTRIWRAAVVQYYRAMPQN